MKKRLLKQTTTILAVVALLALLGGCAAAGSSRAETSLLSTGFTAKVAMTAKQRQELQTLPEGKVSLVRQNGKTFYVYPDAPDNQIYVGSEAQYQAYENLLAQQPKSTDPFVIKKYIAGHWVPVKVYFGWAPFREF